MSNSDDRGRFWSKVSRLPLKAKAGAPRKSCDFLTKGTLRLIGLIAFVASLLWVRPGYAQTSTTTAKPGSTPESGPITYTPDTDPEVKLGKEAAQQDMKQLKLITSGPEYERLQKIGQELANVADRYPIPALWGYPNFKPFKFSFYLVDNKDVNAYSYPGGFVFVDKGLMDFVHSDDELAAVLAHEMGHVMHHHILKLLHEQGKLQNILTPLQLAAIGMIIAGHFGDNSTAGAGFFLANGSQLYQVARMNGYSVHAEEDADHYSILLLTHTHFDPAAMYTFMSRLANTETPQELGILRDHPPTPQRVEAAKHLLESLHIPLSITTADPAWRANVTDIKKGNDDLAQISVKGIVVCSVVGLDGESAHDRAVALATKLDQLLDSGLQAYEIHYAPNGEGIMLRNTLFLTQADAQAQGTSLEQLKQSLGNAIIQIIQMRQIEFSN
jgi:Zn-dependent protease with chaperone function